MIECQLLGFDCCFVWISARHNCGVQSLSAPTVSDFLRQMSLPQTKMLATNISVNLFHLSLATCHLPSLLTLKPLLLPNVLASQQINISWESQPSTRIMCFLQTDILLFKQSQAILNKYITTIFHEDHFTFRCLLSQEIRSQII